MQHDGQHPWLREAYHWFDEHPEREFRRARMPLLQLPAIAAAGVFVGCAGHASVPCIIRRADPASGRDKLGVYLIDGAAPPRFPSAGAEEHFCETVWGLAHSAEQGGVSLVALMTDPAKLASAAATPLPVRARQP